MRTVGSAFKEAKNAPVVKPIFLYKITFDPTSNASKFYTSWPGGITFDGQAYAHFEITHSAIREDISGQIQTSSLEIANVSREIQALIDDNDGLRNRPVTITQVWFETIGDATAFISDSFVIVDTTITQDTATFSLASVLDVFDIRLPRRNLTRTFCRFRFKGEECGYTGTETKCNKSLTRCRELDNSNRFGGFPTTPLQNQFEREA